MDFEHINEDDLIEDLERLPPTPITAKEARYGKEGKAFPCPNGLEFDLRTPSRYVDMKQGLWKVEKQLQDIVSKLCELTSKIGNIITKLNHMDNCVVLRDG